MRANLKIVSVKMSEQRLAQLHEVAKDAGCNLSAVIRQAIRLGLDKHWSTLIVALREAA
jgi:metal-responsive CopG/Arc/MetJ family transcriptional regulator